MKEVIADLHTHTLASSHAYSTVIENAAYAASRGLYAIGFTDHGPTTPDSPHEWHAASLMHTLPSYINGIRIFRGVEANITDWEGHLDVPDNILAKLEIVIASYHSTPRAPGTVEQTTSGWLGVLNNPYVDIMGHSGQNEFRFDYETVIKEAKKLDKVVEINNHSFAVRRGARENCREIAALCMKHGVMIAINSDAHFAGQIGHLDHAYAMLDELHFPDELVLNGSVERLNAYLMNKPHRAKK